MYMHVEKMFFFFVLWELPEFKKNLDSLGVVKTFGSQKNGETWIVWVLQNSRNSKKWGKMNSLGVVGTLGIQKIGKLG